jgi:formylglycine-generating enzyme
MRKSGTWSLGLFVLLAACGGSDGQDGTKGATGAKGNPGDAGQRGATGANALVVTKAEPAGPHCMAGGFAVSSGVDADGDGNLSATETVATDYVCDGELGATGAAGAEGVEALVAVTDEPAGSGCTNGGQRITAGRDANRNRILDASEVTATRLVCNGVAGQAGVAGAAGHNSLVTTTDEPSGDKCVAGGKRVELGVDLDDDGVLDAGEVQTTTFVCHGAPGAAGPTGATGETGATGAIGATGATGAIGPTGDPGAVGSAGPAGATGAVGASGADGAVGATGADGAMGAVGPTGAVGATGATGANGIGRIGPTGATGATGATGRTGSIGATGPIGATGATGATGAAGLNALIQVTTEPKGPNCANGGKKIETGIDTNGNAALDPGEVNASATTYICTPGMSHGSCAGRTDGHCTSLLVDGGTFYRGTSTDYPATVSSFILDKYEVSVSRFRKFVDAYTVWRPSPGDGAHPLIPGSGWQTAWDARLPATTDDLPMLFDCSIYPIWTDAVGANEALPMACVSWYLAFAFCAWDGGRLPTEAEWEYSAAGGANEQTYPWGEATPNGTLAVYDCMGDGSAAGACATADILKVGSKPLGNGRWGQSDLAGSLYEMTLDLYASVPDSPCVDCAHLSGSSTSRVIKGGNFTATASTLPAAHRAGQTTTDRSGYIGFRCARSE